MSDAGTRLFDVRARIAKAADTAGRPPADVTLVAVSKTQPADAIAPLIEAGQQHFGENRVQEAQAKWPPLLALYPELRLHLVGRLQSNKATEAVALFHVIHSLDRASLVTALARAQDRLAIRPTLLVQVDLAGEPQKGGCTVAELPGLLAIARDSDLLVTGLMTVPPVGREPAPWFALMAKLARDNGVAGLSMGMSGDFETAVKLGATYVRVGTALFGSRT